jgi:hypothetical protein
MSTMQATLGPIAGLIAPNRSNAQGEPARRLLELWEKNRGHLLSSHSVRDARERLLEDLEKLCAEAACPGWDGYGAAPISEIACGYARAFILALPTSAPLPELNADTDGEVSLDWSFGKRRALSVSIGHTGRCTFAWVLGQRSIRGTDWIEDEIPAQIALALHQLA